MRMERSKGARLKDVADLAGLSPTTISRYLNGAIELPRFTVDRIEQAVEALAYRPNPHARSLSRGVSGTIGIALPDIANPFFGNLAASVEAAARGRGRSVMLSSTMNGLAGELEAFRRLEQGYFDTLLFATNRVDSGELAEAVSRNADRVVLLDEDIAGTAVSKVFSDNLLGGRLAGRELTSAGHRCLAYVGGPQRLLSAEERGQGFVDAAGEVARIHAIHCPDYTAADGRAATEALLADRPDVTAIFFGSDALMLGAIPVLRAAGRRIGQDVSVVTFDDAEPLGFFDPPITAIRHHTDALAEEALRLAFERREDGTEVRVPVDLVRRASVAPAVRAVKGAGIGPEPSAEKESR